MVQVPVHQVAWERDYRQAHAGCQQLEQCWQVRHLQRARLRWWRAIEGTQKEIIAQLLRASQEAKLPQIFPQQRQTQELLHHREQRAKGWPEQETSFISQFNFVRQPHAFLCISTAFNAFKFLLTQIWKECHSTATKMLKLFLNTNFNDNIFTDLFRIFLIYKKKCINAFVIFINWCSWNYINICWKRQRLFNFYRNYVFGK